jgi:predicted DNA-binding transcriptional regulator AlpA
MKKLEMVCVTTEQLESLVKCAVKESFLEGNPQRKCDRQNDFLNREEVMKLLKISPGTLYNWTNQGKIRAYGLGAKIYYRQSEIESLLVPLKTGYNEFK